MIHILGAGIAGLTLAEALTARGMPWRIYEKTARAGEEASGKNAGIVRTYEADPVFADLTRESLAYYQSHEPSWNPCGLILRPWEVDYSAVAEGERPFSHGRYAGGFFPANGTIDPPAMMARLAVEQVKSGEILFNFAALVEFEAKKITGLNNSANNQRMSLGEGEALVVAGGEGSVGIADACGTRLGLIAHRRTLYEFQGWENHGPVEWNEESGIYFRRGTTLVATAGEQVPSAPGSDESGLSDAAAMQAIEREFPFLNRQSYLGQRTCKRLTPLDLRPYCGVDPQYENLYWFTGLGGRGISIAPALAQRLAAMICGEAASMRAALAVFAPGRATT